MTKKQILDLLATKFYKVPEPELIDTKFEIKEYRMYPWVKEGENVYKQYVSFCVENEGKPEEVAYWSGPEPRSVKEPSFTQKAFEFMNSKILDGTVKFAYIQASNDALKKALVIAITQANVEKKGLIVDDGAGNLSITLI